MDKQEKMKAEKWKKRKEDMFLRRLFGMFAKMAKVDGRIDAWEVHAAEAAFARFPRAAARRRFCINVFNTTGNSSISLLKMAWDFANEFATADDCIAAYDARGCSETMLVTATARMSAINAAWEKVRRSRGIRQMVVG